MNAQTAFVGATPLVPSYQQAYARERAHCRKMEKRLARAVLMLSIECDSREYHGEDVSHIRAFLKECGA